jgi:3'(2'), 5'-bisphosphate nucleotidase
MQLNKALLEKVITVAHEAGQLIMSHYYHDAPVDIKTDGSPVTQADQAADDLIKARLTEISDIPYFSEESPDTPYEERSQWSAFWLVDPLDGTKEFIKRTDEFTVNIALICETQPVLGVIYVPAQAVTYVAHQDGGAYKIEGNKWTKLPLNTGGSDKLRVVVSRSHLDEQTQRYTEDLRHQGHCIDIQIAGSSLKFCLVAEGAADVYPRLAPIMEWDIAAGVVIAKESGATFTGFGGELKFNSHTMRCGHFVVQRYGIFSDK